jgi:membrane fusion protein (multidrug efflux system)
MRANQRTFLFLLLFFALGSCRHGAKEHEGEKEPEGAEEEENAPKHVKVVCAPVRSAQVQDRVELHGTVAPLPDRDAQVSPQVAGRLIKIGILEGDKVKQGQPLAQIDPGPIEDSMREADALLNKAQAESENARVTLQRVERVFQRGIAARQEVDDAKARAAGAAAAEAQATAASRRAHRQVEFATVRSPLSGVVLRLLRRTGELVDGTPATPVVEVGDPSALELVADASPQDLLQLGRGNLATLLFSALPGRSFSGSVAAVAPAVDRTTGLGKVRIAMDLSHGAAPPVGLYGTAQVAAGPQHPALLVPAQAVRSRTGAEAEIIVCGSDGAAHVRRLQLGVSEGTELEVRGELAATDRVAVEPVIGINEGDKLEAESGK